MAVVLLSPNAHWRAPLAALLRERRAAVVETDDVFEAVAALRTLPDASLVLHTDVPSAERMTLLRSVVRHAPATRIAVAGAWTAEEAALAAALSPRVEANAWALVTLAEWARPTDPDDEGPWDAADPLPSGVRGLLVPTHEPGRPVDVDVLARLLRFARHEPYSTLLGVGPDADADAVQEAAWAWIEQLDGWARQHPDDGRVAEVRAAVEDARDILCDPAAAAWYRGRAGGDSAGAGPPQAPPPQG